MNEERKRFIGGVDFDELRAQRVQIYDTITLDLGIARSEVEFTITGNYIYVVEATEAALQLYVRFNEKFRKQIYLHKGRGVRTPFYRLYLTNAALVGKSITLAIGIEGDIFQILDTGKVSVIEPIEIKAGAGGAYGQLSVTNVATLIHAVTSNRRSLLIQNLDTANDLYLGYDASVTIANGGHCVKPWGAIEINTQKAVYGIRAAGVGNAAWMEETN